MSHKAFFYGTLMSPPILHRVISPPNSNPSLSTIYHPSLTSHPALLPSHTRHKVLHADYPAVLPSPLPSSCVRGVLVSGLTDGDLWRLDVFEGSEYERRKVKVRLLARDGKAGERKGEEQVGEQQRIHGKEQADGELGEEVEAETYIWTAGASRLDAEEWDFDEFVREKMARWLGGGVDADSGFRGMS